MGWWDNPPTGMKVIAPVNMQQFYAKVIDKNISIDWAVMYLSCDTVC